MSLVEKLSAPVGMVLDRFIAKKQEEFPFATGELSQLLRDIALAAKIINREINRAGLADLGGNAGSENIQGETQQKLDVVADIRFKRALKFGGETCCIISEEVDEPILTNSPDGKYVVAIDPLDGSSNIDVNVSIGTIFSIYRRKSEVNEPLTELDYLQKGDEQVAAGYILYGSSTMLVYTTGHGVNGFTLEPSLGEYFLSHPDIKMPTKGLYYSMNDNMMDKAGEGVRKFIKELREDDMSSRYIGSLVGDFHRNLLKGGIYLYPPTPSKPNGKLRLMYECNALAFITEQAGGLSYSGNVRTMEIQPTKIHQRVPFYVGTAELVKRLLEMQGEV
jgi:fructose-1,6-bisphosphatase I